MRIAFFGGSFNPPHYGHFLAAAWALCSGEVDQVWMVPCASHAFGKSLAPYAHRFAMCQIGANLLSSAISICDIEAKRDGPSYTIDTIEILQHAHPSHSFRLLVGSDILHETHAWKSFERLVQISPLLLVPRGGFAQDPTSTIHIPEVSSSQIRDRLQQNLDVQGLLPPSIHSYILTHALYLTSSCIK